MADSQTGDPIKTLASPSSWSEEILGWCNQMSVTPDKLIHREFTRKSLQLQIKTVYHASHFLLPRIQITFDFLFGVLLTFLEYFTQNSGCPLLAGVCQNKVRCLGYIWKPLNSPQTRLREESGPTGKTANFKLRLPRHPPIYVIKGCHIRFSNSLSF